jgi:ATP-dependent Clp protease ATP-binding subunit ClpA
MTDSRNRIERLSNAAYETATRNQNSSIGPDHLLYVVCSTEEGRRDIEARGGDYKLILNYLKRSFMSRAEPESVTAPDFNPPFQEVMAEPVMRLREGDIKEINISSILLSLIENHRVCPITTSALIRGGLVDEVVAQEEEEGATFDEEMSKARAEIESRMKDDEGHEPSQTEDHESNSDEDNKKRAEELSEQVQAPANQLNQDPQDPQLAAVIRAMRNLTKKAEENALDPVIGRDEEIDRVVDVLQRRRKGSVLLVGEPGVGKTAVAEGVAQLLAQTDTPASVASRPIYEVSVSDLLAGTRYRGDFEQRMRHLVNIATGQRAILFIDEAHILMGAGSSSSGSVDAPNFLKPAMARGDIKVIAATTSTEARALRKDKALMRRFEILHVREPDAATSVQILEQVEEVYSAHHGISYEDGVAARCVELAIRHIPDRRLPDKALDVLDTAAVEAKNAGASYVSEEFAVLAISSMTGVNAGRPTSEEIAVVRDFPVQMQSRIFGQQEALETLEKAVRISSTGVSSLGVSGTYLFNGPTGVGKTETAKAMAESLGLPLVRIDMSEYMEPHSVSGLIGAPPGYVGYDDDGALIAAAEAHPRMVLLLDEIEKAHPKVFDILLQVLDEGRLTSADGREVSLRGAHIVMTGNIGSNEAAKEAIGFGRKTDEAEAAEQAIAGTFRKELLSRIKHKIQFRKLGDDVLQAMVNAEIGKMVSNLTGRGFKLTVEPSVSEMITELARRDGATGRIIGALVDTHVANPIAECIVMNEEADEMKIDVEDDNVKVSPVFQ